MNFVRPENIHKRGGVNIPLSKRWADAMQGNGVCCFYCQWEELEDRLRGIDPVKFHYCPDDGNATTSRNWLYRSGKGGRDENKEIATIVAYEKRLAKARELADEVAMRAAVEPPKPEPVVESPKPEPVLETQPFTPEDTIDIHDGQFSMVGIEDAKPRMGKLEFLYRAGKFAINTGVQGLQQYIVKKVAEKTGIDL